MHSLEAPPFRNLEQKFRCPDLDPALCAGLRAGARLVETMRQRDVFFAAGTGRLKLRSIDSDRHGPSHELIAYQRPDGVAERLSEYRLVAVADAAGLEAVLAAGLGIRAVVCKTRRLLMDGNLRIHLDEVERLGSFVEFEAVLGPGDTEGAARDLIARWRTLLGLTQAVAVSYVDLLEA